MWFQCGRDSWVREVAHSVGVPLLGGGYAHVMTLGEQLVRCSRRFHWRYSLHYSGFSLLQTAQFCRSEPKQNSIRTESYWPSFRIRLGGWLRVCPDCVLLHLGPAKVSRLQYERIIFKGIQYYGSESAFSCNENALYINTRCRAHAVKTIFSRPSRYEAVR